MTAAVAMAAWVALVAGFWGLVPRQAVEVDDVGVCLRTGRRALPKRKRVAWDDLASVEIATFAEAHLADHVYLTFRDARGTVLFVPSWLYGSTDLLDRVARLPNVDGDAIAEAPSRLGSDWRARVWAAPRTPRS